MTQLILDTTGYNMVLPESIKNGYFAEEQPLFVDVEMILGRVVRQLRGNVWHITYQYGFFDDDTKNKWISACRKGTRQAITCGFLPPDSSGTLLYSNFLVMAFTYLNSCGVRCFQEKMGIPQGLFGGIFPWSYER